MKGCGYLILIDSSGRTHHKAGLPPGTGINWKRQEVCSPTEGHFTPLLGTGEAGEVDSPIRNICHDGFDLTRRGQVLPLAPSPVLRRGEMTCDGTNGWFWAGTSWAVLADEQAPLSHERTTLSQEGATRPQ